MIGQGQAVRRRGRVAVSHAERRKHGRWDTAVIDDADVELALDEVLAETIRRSTTPDDDDEAPIDNDPLVDPLEAILPKQDDEFRCKSCRLLKKTSQLADPAKTLCRDCV